MSYECIKPQPGIITHNSYLRRNRHPNKKSRVDRWLNIDGKFELKNEKTLFNKHVLLVDDIITNGATLEACVTVMNNINGIQISIATLA
jgi:competence protein ComFC